MSVSDPAAQTMVQVKYTCACPNCGTTNVEEERPMKLVDFNRMVIGCPKDYWKEAKGKETVYRMHEEDSSARCRTSC